MSTIVYKFRAWPAVTNAALVDKTFEDAETYYDELVHIENHRRALYRQARTRLFPDIKEIEEARAKEERTLSDILAKIREAKKVTRSRAVPPELAQAAATQRVVVKAVAAEQSRLYAERKGIVTRYRALQKKIEKDGESEETKLELEELLAKHPADAALIAESAVFEAEADAAVKALRKTLYWGTYLLVEDAFSRAKVDEPGWLTPKSEQGPAAQRRGRIGIQIQGGLAPSELVDDTRIQLHVENISRAGQKPSLTGLPTKVCKPHGTFRLRVGSDGRNPVWADFPVRIHRALPDDASIKWAVITREPGHHLSRPWIYHLCLTVVTQKYARPSGEKTKKICTINFGWRLMENTLRVATINFDGDYFEHVDLPVGIYRRWDKCKDLQAIIDKHFDEAKLILGGWIALHKKVLPQAFLESFERIAAWKSCSRLEPLVAYWKDHRLPGDDEVFAALWQWRGKWMHLYEWMTANRQKAMRERREFYRLLALRIARTANKIVVESFHLPDVAERPDEDEEDEGGRAARENRTRAAVGELRQDILQACSKYQTEVEMVGSKNNTRRCNVCGQLHPWDPARDLEHTCPGCGATWDQDVNNTDNSHERIASGRVATLVEVKKDQGNREGKISAKRAARRKLPKEAK